MIHPIHACSKCRHFACVCRIKEEHEENCEFRRAATCDIPIACEEHGRDTCPMCAPCTCVGVTLGPIALIDGPGEKAINPGQLRGMYFLRNHGMAVLLSLPDYDEVAPMLPLHDDMTELMRWALENKAPCDGVGKITDPMSFLRELLSGLLRVKEQEYFVLMLNPTNDVRGIKFTGVRIDDEALKLFE